MPSAFVVLRFIIPTFCGPLLTTARLSSFRPPQADGMDGLRLCDEDRNLTFCAHLIIRIRRVCRQGERAETHSFGRVLYLSHVLLAHAGLIVEVHIVLYGMR